jgi:hypothetical protein
MLRLTPRRIQRVPNGLAILGAFLLAASVLAGAGHSMPAHQQQAGALAGTRESGPVGKTDAKSAERFEAENTVRETAVAKTRKFRVNLFLFRH